jgi:hypothetical protein
VQAVLGAAVLGQILGAAVVVLEAAEAVVPLLGPVSPLMPCLQL